MTESDRIRRLDPTTVERIAAGEVVERPASVVKELVENGLDADADRVDVAVAAGGTESIRVRDDGVGMSEADVRAAVQQHTTSKIRDADDLEGGVATLGFRGEALSTIGAVSRTTITTRPRGGDGGTELRIEGGEVTHVGPAGCPEGTTVAVDDLFFNTPARRKYLKREATEFAHVNRVVTRYALANPGVAVSLTHDGRETFATAGRGDLREALLSVYGREVATSMVEVDPDGVADATDAVEGIRGYVSDPETTRSSREYVATFVNGRYVSDATVRDAVLAGYGNRLAPDRYPFAVLFLDVPADEVDVNVHPRKMEVRFGDEEAVRGAVETAVEDALLDAGLIRSSAPRGRSAPDETSIRPESGDASGSDAADERLEPSADAAGHPESGERTAGPPPRPDGADASDTRDAAAPRRPAAADSTADPDEPGDGSESTGGVAPAADRTEERPAGDPGGKFAPETRNARLSDAVSGDTGADAVDGDADQLALDRLPPMRVLGQVRETYVVAETPSGVVLVDQHAADERVNYERLCAAVADRSDSQRFVSPVELELTAAEAAVFDDALAELRAMGFDAGLADDRTARVTAVPAVFADALDPALLRDALAELLAEDTDRGAAVESAADALLADLACYPSITGDTSLAEGAVVDLLRALDACENPYACPHGRPVVVELSEQEIADRFERDYPGHRTRRPEE